MGQKIAQYHDGTNDISTFNKIVVDEIEATNTKLSGTLTLTGSGLIENNGTEALSITNVGPAGIQTPTIQRWMKILLSGTEYYIPLWS